jgi:hypothetical protein
MHRVIRFALVLVGLAFAARASHAGAGGMNLSWDDCGVFGSVAKTFACDTNVGTNAIICSAIPPVPMPQFVAMGATIELEANGATLPSWWNFDVGCRAGPPSALTIDFNFLGGPFNCHDAWGGQAIGGMNYESGFSGPNRARLRMVCAVASPAPLDGVSENYFFRFSISNAHTTGTGSCAGCDVGMCLVLTKVELDQPIGVGDFFITNPLDRQFVVWQNGGSVPGGGCPQATPTRTTTWGAVKSLYR